MTPTLIINTFHQCLNINKYYPYCNNSPSVMLMNMYYFFLKIMDNGKCPHPVLGFSGSLLRLTKNQVKMVLGWENLLGEKPP